MDLKMGNKHTFSIRSAMELWISNGGLGDLYEQRKKVN